MIPNELTIASGVIDALLADVAGYGERRLETGGFFMASTGQNHVSGLALAGESGILRQYNLFQISERALDRLFTYAVGSELWLPAQYHSHILGAQMSLTDARHGLNVEGFTSTILPTFGAPPREMAAWGWWIFTGGRWNDAGAAAASPGPATAIVIFDEDGVRGR